MKITTIKINIETKEELDKIKIIPEETYNNVIIRLIKNIRGYNEKDITSVDTTSN